jgi:hypothetical protein
MGHPAIPIQLTAQHTRYIVTDIDTLGGTFSLAGGFTTSVYADAVELRMQNLKTE